MKQILVILILTAIILHSSADSLQIYTYSQEHYPELVKNRAVITDHRGLLYAGNDNGVMEYDGVTWRTITVSDSGGVYALAVDPSGRIFVGAHNEFGSLFADNKGTMHYKSLTGYLPEKFRTFIDNIHTITIAQKTIYFCADRYIFIMTASHDTTVKILPAKDFFYSTILVEDQLFVCDGEEGLLRISGDSLETVMDGATIASYVMLPADSGRILIVTIDKGLTLFDPSTSSQNKSAFTPVALNPLVTTGDIRSGICLKNGNYIFGSIRDGCYIVDTAWNVIKHITSGSGLINPVVYETGLDNRGNIWLGLDKGITVLSWLTGSSSDSGSTFIRSFLGRENDSMLFYGAFRNDSTLVQIDKQPPTHYYKFNYKFNAFRFTYGSDFFTASDTVKYQYYLEGLENTWCELSGRTYCEYTSLDRGKYTFHVRSGSDQKRGREAAYSFYIYPPWFESLWFYGLQIVVGFLLLVLAAFLYKIGKVEKLAGSITSTIIVVIFGYINIALTPLFSTVATGIAIFDLLINIIIANIIQPVQDRTDSIMEKFVKKGLTKKVGLYTDSVTKAFNSTYMLEFLEKELSRVQRYETSLSCILFSITNSKEYIQFAGAAGWKKVLREIAILINRNIRSADNFGRLSENTFLLILPETSKDAAHIVVGKIHAILDKYIFSPGKREIKLSFSIGVESAIKNRDTSTEIILNRLMDLLSITGEKIIVNK